MDNSYMYSRKPWPNTVSNNISDTPDYHVIINSNRPVSSNQTQQPTNIRLPIYYSADIPIELAKSLEGKYFIGVAENLKFGDATGAWARLYNPPDSGVNLHVYTWTVSDVISSSIRVQMWFNGTPPGIIQESLSVTPGNTAFVPLPEPKVKLEYAVGVRGYPEGGVRAYGRSGPPGATVFAIENGAIIFPPGGSFLVYISNPETPTLPAAGRIAFAWWEEPIQP